MTILSAIAANQLRILLVHDHWLSVGIPLSVEFRLGPPMKNSIFPVLLALSQRVLLPKPLVVFFWFF